MTRASLAYALRAQRKQDLLLASQAVRLQALASLDTLAARADALAARLALARSVLTHPAVALGAALLGIFAVRLGQRRRRSRPWLRWAWLAWRAWRAWQAAGPLLGAVAVRR